MTSTRVSWRKEGHEKKRAKHKVYQRLYPNHTASLPVQPVKDVAVLYIPLPATTGQRRSAVNKAIILHTKHTQLNHSRHKRRIPSALAKSKSSKRKRSSREVCNVLVRRQGKRRIAALSLRVVLVVPSTGGIVERGTSFRSVAEELLGCRVCADESGEIDGAEAFGC